MGGGGGAEHVVQAGAEVVPGLRVELAPVGEDEVLEAGDAGPGDKGITKRRIDTIIQFFLNILGKSS